MRSENIVSTSNSVIDVVDDGRCTGCSACVAVCPRNALTMEMSPEGFWRPQIAREQCHNCGLCLRKCPVLLEESGDLARSPWPEPKAFAAWSCDESVRLASSSGGVFSELAKVQLKNGGAVIGCGWTDDWLPVHMIARTEHELLPLRRSKYVQSRMGEILTETLELCKEGVPVLFSGTPCQIAALKHFISLKDQDQLTTCEVICLGVPSVRVFRLYLNWLFEGELVREFSFRCKSLGLHTVKALSGSGRTYETPLSADPYGRISNVYHITLMMSCFRCVFQKLPRLADITLGDFWGVPATLDDPKGVSVVLVNSPKGEKLFREAARLGAISSTAVELAVAVQKNPRATGKPLPIPKLRGIFFRDVARGQSFQALMRKYYIPINFVDRVKRRLMWLFLKMSGK
ncbi:MAG: Coenzyme F420 hydrogenase/dehydrogenase, beta subunit C-terminal domain [Sedimentisphaerales bacterium]|nr:Coenzyme F420 hydrogenase/dehydrogenase, beta subunit C-terminal domain [Sedimentisphaerales bacterium]